MRPFWFALRMPSLPPPMQAGVLLTGVPRLSAMNTSYVKHFLADSAGIHERVTEPSLLTVALQSVGASGLAGVGLRL